MAHGSETDGASALTSPRRIARAGRLLGTGLLLAGWGGALVAIVWGAPAGEDRIAWVLTAMDTPLTAVGTPSWAVHVAVLVALSGVWLLGLALLVEGYVGVE